MSKRSFEEIVNAPEVEVLPGVFVTDFRRPATNSTQSAQTITKSEPTLPEQMEVLKFQIEHLERSVFHLERSNVELAEFHKENNEDDELLEFIKENLVAIEKQQNQVFKLIEELEKLDQHYAKTLYDKFFELYRTKKNKDTQMEDEGVSL